MALFVGRLPSDTRHRDLESLFSKYGRLTRCDIKRGYAFIEYEDQRDADDALRAVDGVRFLGERIVVEWAKGGRRTEECFKCGRLGHWARSCPLTGGSRDGRNGGRDRSRSRDRRRGSDRDRYEWDRDRGRSRSRDRIVDRADKGGDREYRPRDRERDVDRDDRRDRDRSHSRSRDNSRPHRSASPPR